MSSPAVNRAIDGGSIALSGFLYQLIASAAAAVHFMGNPRAVPSSADAVLRLEFGGQDAALDGNNGKAGTIELIQFKYSESAAKFTASEVLEIAEGLEKSGLIIGAGSKAHIRYTLTSNRSFPSNLIHNAQSLLDKRMAIRGRGKAPVTKKKSKGKKTAPKISVARAKQITAVLKVLKLQSFSQSMAHAALVKFSRKFAVTQAELEYNVSTLVGKLTAIAAGGASPAIRAEHIAAWLSGAPFSPTAPPRDLQRSAILTYLSSDLDDIDTFFDIKGKPAPRADVVNKVLNHVRSRSKPVIALVGNGGSGKTVALSLVARKLLEKAPPEYVGMSMPPLAAQPVATLVGKWRGNIMPGENDENAFVRLVLASEDRSDLVLSLGVDGIDEKNRTGTDFDQNMRGFLDRVVTGKYQQAVKGHRLVVITTCRNRSELENLCSSDPTGERFYEEVSVEDFSDVDLEEQISGLPPAVRSQLDILILSPRPYGVGPLPSTTTDGAAVAALSPHIAALRTPLYWGVFCLLPNEAAMLSYVCGEPTGLHAMAAAVWKKFWHRLGLRFQPSSLIQLFKKALHDVAMNTTNAQFGLSQFVTLCTQNAVLNSNQASDLRQEVDNFGLIEITAAPAGASEGFLCRWRFEFIRSNFYTS